jgi:SAM-dependent methyltransferase
VASDVPPDSRWIVRGSAEDLVALVRRTADFLESLGRVTARRLSMDRDGDDIVLTVVFDHWGLPADLDYLDPRVAAGHFGEEQRDDIDFMVALAAEVDARTVVDFGCGTGQLAVALAQRGYRVIAVDPAKAMLDLARNRRGAELVEWVRGDVYALDVTDADLVVMTGNVPSTYVTDDAWDRLLGSVRAALRPGGHLSFGSWNPRVKPWEGWGWDGAIAKLIDGGGARVRVEGMGIELGGGETLYAASEWRYRTDDELTRSLTDAGFMVEHVYGDWRRSPLTASSPDIVVVGCK